MNNKKGSALLIVLIIILVVLAIGWFWYYKNNHLNPVVPQNIPQQTVGNSSLSADPYANIVDVDYPSYPNISDQYSCGGYMVTSTSTYVSQPNGKTLATTDLILEPLGKVLSHVAISGDQGFPVADYYATFNKNCSIIYYGDTMDDSLNNAIETYDISGGATSTIKLPPSTFPSILIPPSSLWAYTGHYPSLYFLYAIDSDHLLLWFNNPIAEPGVSGSYESEAIYNISTQSIRFINDGYSWNSSSSGDEIALLDDASNTLLIFQMASNTPQVTRSSIDLTTGDSSAISLESVTASSSSDYYSIVFDPLISPVSWTDTSTNVGHTSDECGDDTLTPITVAQAIQCRDSWLSELLQ